MKKQEPNDASMKILMIGNSGVGKTGILIQFCEKKFVANYYNTIGVDFKIKYVNIDDKTIKMQIWDTAGQDRFKTITSSYYRGANGIIVVYDITDRSSFDSVRTWLKQIDKYADQKIKKYVVGNKSDLEQRRQITSEQGLELARSLGMQFIETSARTSNNIEVLYKNIAKMILQNTTYNLEKEKVDQGVKKLIMQRKEKQQGGYCC